MTSSPPPGPIPDVAKLPLVIDTPRLKLRPLAVSDVEDLWPYASDPELPRMMSWAVHTDRSETIAWIELSQRKIASGESITWGIEREGHVIGTIGLDGIRWQMRALRVDRAELGYWIGAPHRRQGLMTEAAFAVTRWGFETLGLHKVTVSCFEGNTGSQRVIENVGFRFFGVQEDDVWRDGRWYAHRRYELTVTEWGDAARTQRFSRPRPPT